MKELWRMMAISLIAVLVTGMGSYLMIGATKPSRGEVVDMIGTHSPYTSDRIYVDSTLKRHSAEISGATKVLQEIKVTQAEMHGKVDLILKSLDK